MKELLTEDLFARYGTNEEDSAMDGHHSLTLFPFVGSSIPYGLFLFFWSLGLKWQYA